MLGEGECRGWWEKDEQVDQDGFEYDRGFAYPFEQGAEDEGAQAGVEEGQDVELEEEMLWNG